MSSVVDVRTGGWDIRGRWFGVVVGATPRLRELQRGETIPWRVIAAQIAPANAAARADQIEPALIGGSTNPLGLLRDSEFCGSPHPNDLRRTTETMKEIIGRSLGL